MITNITIIRFIIASVELIIISFVKDGCQRKFVNISYAMMAMGLDLYAWGNL